MIYKNKNKLKNFQLGLIELKFLFVLFFILTTLTQVTGCFTNNGGSADSSSSSLLTDEEETEEEEEEDEQELDISTVNIVAGTGSDDESLTTTIYFEAEDDNLPISDYCDTAGNKTCTCEFSWTEINTNSGSSVSIPRVINTTISSVQNYVVICPAPEVYSTEIDEGTTIKITISSSSGTLDLDAYNYITSSTVDESDFRDQEGHAFINIHRYSCYEKIAKGLEITSKESTATNSVTGETKDYLIGTQLCVAGEGGGDGCESGETENSAQSYWYDLFVTSTNRGAVVAENERYVCPRIQETLVSDGTIGSEGSYWPMDSTFALAKGKTDSFNVSVESYSVLGASDDPSTADTSCNTEEGDDGAAGGGSDNAISIKCLGFAMKPDTDGTCPYFKDSAGSIRMTYRLRKFLSLYPVSYDGKGEPIDEPRGTNIIYVLDRPVSSDDPLKPNTMLGPKPCPFAWFDHKGVLEMTDTGGGETDYNGHKPGYMATSNPLWTGKNIDDIHFPNIDSKDENKCATTFPIVTYTDSGSPDWLVLATTHASNEGYVELGGGKTIYLEKVYVRPQEKKWWSHYEEDTDFEACAPESDDFQDAPLHFAKNDDGNVAWCAESYPTQNGSVDDIDKEKGATLGAKSPGHVVPFTSHAVKNSSSATCTATVPDLEDDYPPDTTISGCDGRDDEYAWGKGDNSGFVAAARHPDDLLIDYNDGTNDICSDKSCDRTIINTGTGSWKKYPLLAPAHSIEDVLRTDKSFICAISHDNEDEKEGNSPSSGCCATDQVSLGTEKTALTPVDTHLADGIECWLAKNCPETNAYEVYAEAAHLEPDVRCTIPDY